MLLVITPTGGTFAWIVKDPASNIAVAAGFGSPTQAHAENGGRIFLALMGELADG